jgi:hypothetical protein
LHGNHQVWRCGFRCGSFDIRGRLLFRLPSSPFRGYCGFGLRFLRPGRLPGGGHFRLLRSHRDLLWRGVRMWVGGWSCGGLGNTPPSDDVVPSLAQFHLLCRGTGPLDIRSDRLACGDALSAVNRRLPCNGCPRLLPLYTAAVVRCVVTPATATLWLFPRGGASTGEVGVPTSDAPRNLSAVALRVAEALAALALQWSLWSHVRLHRHSQTAEFGE